MAARSRSRAPRSIDDNGDGDTLRKKTRDSNRPKILVDSTRENYLATRCVFSLPRRRRKEACLPEKRPPQKQARAPKLPTQLQTRSRTGQIYIRRETERKREVDRQRRGMGIGKTGRRIRLCMFCARREGDLEEKFGKNDPSSP